MGSIWPRASAPGGEKMQEKLKESIGKLKNSAYYAYSGQTRNYKQKLLYNLLSAIRAKDRTKFLDRLDTNLNGIKGDDQKGFISKLKEEYENIVGAQFETYAYAIVAGILASKDREFEEKPMEAEQNE